MRKLYNKHKRIISIILILIMVSISMFASLVDSYANPALPLLGLEAASAISGSGGFGAYAVLMGSTGATVNNDTSNYLILKNQYDSLPAEDKSAFEQIALDWGPAEGLVYDSSLIDRTRSAWETQLLNNQVINNFMANNIVTMQYTNGVSFTFCKTASSIKRESTSLKDYLIYYTNQTTYQYFYITDNLRIYSSSDSNLIIESGSGTTWSPIHNETAWSSPSKYFGFAINEDSGYLSIHIIGQKWSEPFYTIINLDENNSVLSVSNFIKNQVYDLNAKASITYNVYNPPLNEDNKLVLPVPIGVTWGDLLGKTAQEINNIGVTDPGTTPADKTTEADFPILGSIKGVLDNTLAGVTSIATAISTFFSIEEFDIDWEPLKVNFTQKFPFCIPFDFINLISVFSANPTDFQFHIDLQTSYFTIDHYVNLSDFMVPIMFFRYIVVAWFIYILISKTRDLIKW